MFLWLLSHIFASHYQNHRRMKKIIFTILTISICALSSCYYDKEAKLYSNKATSSTCDTAAAALVYGQTIKTIIDQNCSMNSCHSSASHQSNVITDTYDGLKNAFQNRNLMCTVEQTGCSPMPKSSSKLSDCKILQLKTWQQRGFPQ